MRPSPLFAASLLTFVLVLPAFPAGAVYCSTYNPAPEAELFSTPSQNDGEAAVSITGKVKTPEGRGIKGAYIVIRDASTNEVIRTTYSSSFGYYRLEQIETGRSYVLSVTHRRYLFALPAQLLEINEERSGMDFVGEPDED